MIFDESNPKSIIEFASKFDKSFQPGKSVMLAESELIPFTRALIHLLKGEVELQRRQGEKDATR
jgi:hypothetical protein